MGDIDCHYGDHAYHGGAVCVSCGKKLRCFCGRFVREDEMEKHFGTEDAPGPCPWVVASGSEGGEG